MNRAALSWAFLLAAGLAASDPAWGASLEEAQAAYSAGDFMRAAGLFQSAAEQGDASAQYNLGVLYENGQGLAKDYGRAAVWYRKSADQGDVNAQNNLANLYMFGLGVPLDIGEAVKWLRKAGEQGEPGAQFNLGILYMLGQSVPQDYAQAQYWLKLAAVQGEAEAQYNLGVMSERGDGVVKDPVEAVAWYILASGKGFAPAVEKQHKLSASLSPEQQSQARQRSAALLPAPVPVSAVPLTEEGPAPSTAFVAFLSLGALIALIGLWRSGRWIYGRLRGGKASSSLGYVTPEYEMLRKAVSDPAECEKIARECCAAGGAQNFVMHCQGKPRDFYGAYALAFFKAGNIAASLALYQMKVVLEPAEEAMIWLLKKVMAEQQVEFRIDKPLPWKTRLAIALELSTNQLNREALMLLDDEVVREAAGEPGLARQVEMIKQAAL